MENWKLNQVTDINCTMDNSGVYVVVNRIVTAASSKSHPFAAVTVRVDIMSSTDTPLQSFVGKGNAVRKHVIAWLSDNTYQEWENRKLNKMSSEHISYIGYEIARAEADIHYVQN